MLRIKANQVEEIVQEVADSVILPRFRNLHSHEIHFKSEDNPITIVDKEAESALKERLLALLPGSFFVGEEDFAANPCILDHFKGDDPVWIVDPLDGTKAFISEEPVFGVIIALAQRNQTIAAWLYDPTSKEFVTAEKGAGAYYKGRKLSVLPPEKLDRMFGIIGSRIVNAYQKCNGMHSSAGPTFLRMLSSCHDYARLVVDGPHFSGKTTQAHFHCWLKTCTPWDNAAGVLINDEAGGYTAHWNGEPFLPADYARGLLTAPDKESWHAIRDWISSFCALPVE